jgi:hypothetical protein
MKTILASSAFIILMFTVSYLAPFNQATDSITKPFANNQGEQPNFFNDSPLLKDEWSPEIRVIITNLKHQYRDQIHLTHVQVQLIYIRDPILQYLTPPYDGQLKKVISAAFPLHVNDIINTWALMDQYEDWLLAQNRTLMELDALSRSGMLWQKREALFPVAAHDIWSEEQDNYENAQLNLQNEIDLLDNSHDLAMIDRVERLKNSFNDSNSLFTGAINKEFANKGTIASVLFGLTAVQQELQQLPPQQRQQEINSVRQQLGFSEGAITKLEAKDIKREKRWSNGNEYMKSRNLLIANNDQVSELELNTLRSKFFGNSAITIAREEASGFYRYQRPRYYGRN